MTAPEGQGGKPIRSIRRNAPARSGVRPDARWLLPVFVLLILASACGGVSKPQGFPEPQLEGKMLYVGLDAGKVAAVNAGDLSVAWEFPDGDNFACGDDKESKHDLKSIYGAPVIDGGAVYFSAYDGNVYALDAQSGDCLWESHKTDADGVQCRNKEPEEPIVSGVLVHDGSVYVGSDDGQIWGIDAETGTVETCRDVGGGVWSTPLFFDGAIYVATMKGKLWAMEPDDWNPKWPAPFEAEAGFLSDVVLAGDKILVGGISQKMYAINASTGEQVWEFAGGNWFWGRPLVDGNTVYATNLDGKVYAIDLESGAAIWENNSFEAPEAIRAAPLLADGVLVVVDRGGNIYSLDPETGEVLKPSPSIIEKRVLANPIEFDGDVLVVSQDGDLYRIKPTGDEAPRRIEVKQ